jgi:predicted RNA-binding protein
MEDYKNVYEIQLLWNPEKSSVVWLQAIDQSRNVIKKCTNVNMIGLATEVFSSVVTNRGWNKKINKAAIQNAILEDMNVAIGKNGLINYIESHNDIDCQLWSETDDYDYQLSCFYDNGDSEITFEESCKIAMEVGHSLYELLVTEWEKFIQEQNQDFESHKL